MLALPAGALAHPEPGDVDGDGVRDEVDNCFDVRNGDQRDTDLDGRGDKCDPDADNDGFQNPFDNCPYASNPGQEDSGDRPGVGDACDKDSDGDLRDDPVDNCVDLPNRDQRDNDVDGTGDACDPDDDEDGEFDTVDNCPLVYNWEQIDQDGDGRGSVCDADDRPSGGGSTGPGGDPNDKRRPGVTLMVARRHKLATIENGLAVRLRCSEACAATARLVADRRTARRLRLSRSGVAAKGSAQVAGSATTYAFVRFSRTAKRRIWRRPVTRLTLRVTAVDRAGNRRTVARRLTLVR
jgi:thrombospondin type 3 repeat protein